MARRLPTKMWAVGWPSEGGAAMPNLHWTKSAAKAACVANDQVGRVTIVWEKPAKKKVRR